jgi:hypothetical protein
MKFCNVNPRGSIQKHFTFFVTLEWAKKAGMFVFDVLLKPSLIFMGKAMSLP